MHHARCRTNHYPHLAVLLFSLVLWNVGPLALGYEYSGHVNTGAYQAQERFSTPASGSSSNDARAVIGSAFFDASKIGAGQNAFTLDLRDKYDAFGQADSSYPHLVAGNEPQLRQLAVKSPKETSSIYWSLGRFPVADASVLGNDGAEFGYKIQPRVSLGAFGGLYPEQIRGKSLKVAREERQVGLVATYQDRGTVWGRNTYATTSFVARQPSSTSTLADDPDSPPPPADPVSPALTSEQTPSQPYVFWYTSLVHQPSPATRLTYLAQVNLEPKPNVRNLWASAYQQLNPRLSGTMSLLRLDLTEYERQRDIRDTLPASVYTAAHLDGRFHFSRTYLLSVQLGDGLRSADGKGRSEINGKLIAASLFGGHVSAFGGGGYRANFLSRDSILRVGASLYTTRTELSLTQQALTETRPNGDKLHPLITELSAGYVASRQLLGSVTLEYAKDERTTVTSTLLTLGYRFTNRQLTPLRDESPPLERL